MGSRWVGERVTLRAFRADDWELFWRWGQDDAWSNADDDAPFPESQERAQAWAAREAPKEDHAGDERRFMIEADGVAVGTIDTNRCERVAGVFCYGVAIAREHRGKGYAAEAITLVLRFYFEERRYQ